MTEQTTNSTPSESRPLEVELSASQKFFLDWQVRVEKERREGIEAAEAQGFKLPTVEHLMPIPAGSNPFHSDSMRMGTELVRGWMAMHDGYDSPRGPLNLDELILINTRTGQRVRVDLTPLYPEKVTEAAAEKMEETSEALESNSDAYLVKNYLDNLNELDNVHAQARTVLTETALKAISTPGHLQAVTHTEESGIKIRATACLLPDFRTIELYVTNFSQVDYPSENLTHRTFFVLPKQPTE